MESKGRNTPPLFMKTYSKCKPKGILQTSRVSPVFPTDEPSYNNRKWINVPTCSPCESEASEEDDNPRNPPLIKKDSHQRKAVPVQQKHKAIWCKSKQQSKGKSFTPLINISNVLANKPCLSSFKRVSSPFKKGMKPRKKVGQMDSIQESDTDDSATTEEEYHIDQHRPRKSSSVNTPMQSTLVAPTTKQSRKVGPMSGFHLMVKGSKILPLGIPLASSTAIDSGGTSETSEDMEDSSDYDTSSEPTNDNATLTEEMSSDEDTLVGENEEMSNEKEEEDDIEVMRDLPDTNQLRIRGKKVYLTPKRAPRKYHESVKIPLERLSLSNNVSSGKKQVSFLLSSKEDQELSDGSMRKEAFNPPQVSTKPSILKKKLQSNSESRDISFSKSMVACDKKQKRMSSTPTRRGKKDKMMQLSFDVSAVHLPSYDISDLIIENSRENTRENIQQLQNPNILPPVETKESNQIDTTMIELRPPKPCVIATAQATQLGTGATQPSNTVTQSSSSTQLPKATVQPHQINIQVPKTTILPVQPSLTPDLLNNDVPQLEDIPIPEDTVDMIEGPIFDPSALETSHITSHATPRSQLKRSSPESHVPFTPSKRKFRMKGPSYVTEVIPGDHLQRKRLEYQDKAVGPPECCITKIDHTTCTHDGVQVIRYVSTHKMTNKELQQMPTDVLEVLFA